MDSKKKAPEHGGVIKRSADMQDAKGDKEEDLYVVNFYHTGDINVQIPVYLAPTAAVVGNITSPKVIVAGRMFGVIAADDVLIAEGGHLWGDIYVTELTVEPKGKVFGWVITLDKGTVELLRTGEIKRRDLPPPGIRPVPTDFRAEHAVTEEQQPVPLEHQQFLYQHFQAELAAAQMARIEIELTFEDRLAEALRQSEVHVIFDRSEFEDKRIRNDEPMPEVVPLDEYRQLESELRSFRLKTSSLLEQAARLNAALSASESELDQLKGDFEIEKNENQNLKTALAELSLYDVLPQGDPLAKSDDAFAKLKAEIAEARLKIIELEGDLAYCRHLSRRSRGIEFDL